MNKKIGLLGIVALVQLLLIGLFWFLPSENIDTNQKLFAFEADEVSRLVISSQETSVALDRDPVSEGWMVAGVPADGGKIDTLIEKLAQLPKPWPVASSVEALQRFEVSPDNYQRKIELFSGAGTASTSDSNPKATQERLVELFLGTSPGFEQVHLRLQGTDEAYAVKLSNYEFPFSIDDWLDKSALSIEEPVTRLEVEVRTNSEARSVVFEKSDEGWLFNGVAGASDNIETYISRLTGLRVSALADAAEVERGVVVGSLVAVGPSSTMKYEISALAARTQNAENSDDGNSTEYLISSAALQDNSSKIGSNSTPVYKVATYIAEQLLFADVEPDTEFAATK